jgi:uncharacterized protein (TIGR02118 family)
MSLQLRTSGLLVLATLLCIALPVGSVAAEKKVTQRCITVLYPNKPGVTFDFDYYLKKHKTLIERLYGKGIKKLELRRGVSTQDGAPVPYVAVINIYIGSQKDFDAAAAKYTQTLIDDVKNFTNGMPVIQNDELVE